VTVPPGTSDATFEKEYRRNHGAIEARLDVLLPPADDAPASLHGAMRYTTLAGGKRIRGILCIGAHELFGDPYPAAALDAACAVEMLHAYTLIHDDLPAIDDDEVRRGLPACHIRYGEAVALLAGDALQARSFEVLAGCECPAQRVVRAVLLFAESAGSRHLVGGQVADIEGEGAEPTPELVQRIHSGKTARLMAAALGIGAILAGAGEREQSMILDIGHRVGLAFQIIDDLLDVEGSERAVGKNLRKDSKRGKITYPACFGVENSRNSARTAIEESMARVQELGDRGYLRRIFEIILERVS
jgi:geranylgeranyl diphosphate synthase type II